MMHSPREGDQSSLHSIKILEDVSGRKRPLRKWSAKDKNKLPYEYAMAIDRET